MDIPSAQRNASRNISVTAITEEYLSAYNSLTTKEILNYSQIFKRTIIRNWYTLGSARCDTKLHMACAPKNKTSGGAGLSDVVIGEKPVPTKKVRTKAEKQAEHIARIKRTLVASLIGIGTGAISFYLGGIPDAAGLQKDGFLGIMLMLAGIVIQKHIFILMGMETGKLGTKDWFYQGFITFAFWFMAWAILLTGSIGTVPSYTANVTTGTAPLAVQFNETSGNSLTSWIWSFTNVSGNNTQVSWSTEQNATQTFGIGNFSIALNASNNERYNVARKVTFINVTAPAVTPVAM